MNSLTTATASPSPPLSAEVLITKHHGLAIHCVTRFLRGRPEAKHLRDDLESEALLALVQAAQTASERANDNVVGFLSHKIQKAILDAVDRETSGGLDPRTARRRRAAGNPLPQRGSLRHDVGAEDGLQDVRERLRETCETEEERQIVRLREAGFSDREIGDRLGWTQSQVFQARRKLEQRFTAAL